jgi:transposase
MLKEADLEKIPLTDRADYVALGNRIVVLTEEVNRLRRVVYGSKTEVHEVGDLIHPKGTIFNDAEEIIEAEEEPVPVEPEPSKKPRKRSSKSGGRKPFPDNLPRRQIICDLSEAEKICPYDGTQLVKIDERIVETLEVIPAKATVIQHVYPKYGCPYCKQHMNEQQALLSAIPQASCDASTLAYIVTQKFMYGLPLYRIEQQFVQMGVEVSRTNLARWVIASADLLGDVAHEIHKYIFAQPVVHADETHVQVLKGTGKSAESKSYMWCACTSKDANPAVWFEFSPNRDKASAASLLGKFGGVLHVDGYESYSSTIAANGITRVGCWAHARRKFDVAKKDGSKSGQSLSAEFLDEIQKLFLFERDFVALEAADRVQQRKEKSSEIVNIIRAKLDKFKDQVPPKSKLGIALIYLTNQWKTLVAFLSEGQAELSNNRIENHIRPFAIGRKNWMFSATAKGAESSALLYTLVSTARANNVDVNAYLLHLLRELPKRYDQNLRQPDLTEFLPWNFKP